MNPSFAKPLHRPLALLAVFLLAAAVPAVGHAQSKASKLAPSLGWLSDLNEAKAQARKTGKPLLVVFRCDP